MGQARASRKILHESLGTKGSIRIIAFIKISFKKAVILNSIRIYEHLAVMPITRVI